MSTTLQAFRLTGVAAALMAVFGMAHAGEAEVNELIKPDSSVSVGIGNWSGPRAQQGIYDGMSKQGAYGLLDADINKRDDAAGTWYKLKVINFGLDNREIRAEYLRQGDIGASVEYNRISRDDPNTYTTSLGGIGTMNQTVSTAAVPGELKILKLGTDRDALSLGFYKNLMADLDLNVSFKNETKKGNRAWGRGSATEFAVEPIDNVTRQLEAILNYTTKELQLSGGYYGSWYDTRNYMVTVNTAGIVGSDTYLSLPLENQAHKLFLNGGYTFTPSTRGTFKYEYTRATQNEHLPTRDMNNSFAGAPSNLNGKINTTLLQFGVTSRPTKELSLAANLRYHDVKDVTPIYRIVQTNAGCASGQCVDNTPLSYKTLTGKLEGTYRLPDGYSVTAGLEDNKQDRTVPVSNANGVGGADTQRVVPWRARLDEMTYRLELRRSLSESLNGSVAYLNSDRKGSTYISSARGPGGTETDLANPINIADRERNKVKVAFDWSPLEKMSIQANAAVAQDIYPQNGREFGLQKGTAQLFGLDANYQVNDNWKANAYFSHDTNRARQTNSRSVSGSKDSDLSDIGDSLGLGLRGNLTGAIGFGADLQWTRNLSKFNQVLTNPQTASFSAALPNIDSTVTKLSLFSTYAVDKSTELRFDLVHERWKTNDWTWMFADMTPFRYRGAAAGGDGTTVTANQRQSSNMVSARYIYKFQ